ncbi:LANO_0H16578g1_1 [Lachancea nothofagi CBS 11611]|uniref:Protoheme IX farnesyltransferase, mitochondrial n=1 Tax=Lachancea nothofagi CBS 11611 TaxID=1266666 RepID=A0A1G4KMT0_9SACH|nr:LANO_0H16578g1_1 [Lachancea nothofagi CBS 11611]
MASIHVANSLLLKSVLLRPSSSSFLTLNGLNIVHRNIRQYSNSKDGDKTEGPLNTSPIEFASNIAARDAKEVRQKMAQTAMEALSCTDDTTAQKSQNLPFEVKAVGREQRQKLRLTTDGVAKMSTEKLIKTYVQLSKPKLTVLVMLSCICSYALSPSAATVLELMSLTAGTALCSTAANAINMGREPDFDRRMVRTQARPVVRGLLTPRQAYKFALVAGTMGVSVLYLGVNTTVAALGATNIALYAWIYTSLKRKHIINTWVGALVGAIPPLMGWTAANPLSDPGGWCLAGFLYAWQFPHFNTLSHNIRNEYKDAGYVMTCWKNPRLNARVAFRYSLLMFPLCYGLSYYNVTDWYYQLDSAIANAWLSFWAFKFWWQQRYNYSAKIIKDRMKFNKGLALANVYARKTFWVSVLHLPAVLILAILHKKGRWDWFFEPKDDAKKLRV